MMHKQSILQIENVYTSNAFQTAGGFLVGAGSETKPMVKLYDMAGGTTEHLDDCPGGMMSFIPVPGQPGFFVSIMGLFPPFVGEKSGLYLHQKKERKWKTVKALELPFAHRCEFIQVGRQTFLIAATVSKLKENPADWSRPGEVHLITMEDPLSLPWKSEVIDGGITRNHGMTRMNIEGTEAICISGAEGIFSLTNDLNGGWKVLPVFEKEVSEMSFIDLDKDGTSEMVTIEPFHGNTLNVYKRVRDEWELRFSDPLCFGHGLSSGVFNGKPVIIVGNRSESLALEMFTIGDLTKGIVNREIIEEGVGPTQTQVFTFGGVEYILSANQKKSEVALYNN